MVESRKRRGSKLPVLKTGSRLETNRKTRLMNFCVKRWLGVEVRILQVQEIKEFKMFIVIVQLQCALGFC